jgi:D-amino peptidase
MRIYIGTDLEGVAGVSTFGVDTKPEGRSYETCKRLLTAEVNAAIDGFLEEGASEFVVSDGHGPGAIHFPDLHPRAELLHGRPLAPREVRDPLVGACDLCVMIGQHAMAGVRMGNLNHTQNSASIEQYTLNGEPIGEIAQFALYQGALGLPMALLTGDDAACREAEALLPGLVTVAVKKGLARNCALSLSADEARRRIREGAAEALRRHRAEPRTPLVWDGPFVLEKRFFHTDAADQVADAPGAERLDNRTVRFRAETIREIVYR